MRITKLHSRDPAYYVGGGGEGSWWGRAPRRLGLVGPVGAEELGAVLAGCHPVSGEVLHPSRRRVRVAGFDLTLGAPKSVSLLCGLGSAPVAGQVLAGHEAAVADALGYLERNAARASRTRDGSRFQVGTEGLVAAGFPHGTSRAGDPHLHDHVVLANLVEGEDGRWSALDARALYRHACTAGYLYQARLRHELCRRLEVRWGPVVNGVANLEGVEREVLVAFSRRRAQVEDRLAAWGVSSPQAAQMAALSTRPRSGAGWAREEWAERAQDLGLDLDRVVGRGRPGGHGGAPDLGRLGRLTHRQLLQEVAASLPEGAPVAEVEARAAAMGRSGAVVARPAWRGERCWTTPARAAAEEELGAWAGERAGGGVGRVDPARVAEVRAERPGLSESQGRAVEGLTSSGKGVEVLHPGAGGAGPGVREGARAAWQAGGQRVVGVAASSRDLARLEAATGIEGVEPGRLEEAAGPGDGRGVVIVVAGAAAVEAEVLRAAARRFPAAKVVLVAAPGGDGPGAGAVEEVMRRVGALEAGEGLAREEPGRWLEVSGTAGGGVLVAESAGALRRAVVDRWWRGRGDGMAMVAPGPSEARGLNAGARGRLAAAGRLGPVVEAGGRGGPELAAGERAWP